MKLLNTITAGRKSARVHELAMKSIATRTKLQSLLDNLTSQIEDTGCAIEFYIMNGYVLVEGLEVPKKNRGKGIGTKAMEKVCKFADDNNVVLKLQPADDNRKVGTDHKKLITFYKSLGFILNGDTMTRTPR